MRKASEAALAALHARDGRREVRYRYELLRGGSVIRELSASGSITLDSGSEIGRTARFDIRDTEEIDWLRDLIRPVMEIRLPDGAWEGFPLGVFVPSTPAMQGNGCEVEAYDRTVILREDCIIEPLFLAAGTPYLDAVNTVLVQAGTDPPEILEPSASKLPADREFEEGSSLLSIINTLLQEINYNPITCDAQGAFVLSSYVEPSAAGVTGSYEADALSVLMPEAQSELDAYGVPNVFRAVCSNPDIEVSYRSVYVNDNPASRLSTVARGRRIVSPLYQPDAIASQEELDAYIRRIAFQAAQVYEEVSFETLNMPLHEAREILYLRHPQAQGIYEETRWSMDLDSGRMSHTARKLVLI